MKNVWLLLGTVVVSLLLIVGISLIFSKPAKNSTVDQAKLLTGATHVLGSDTAPVTIVEFSDFQCPACQASQSVVNDILATYPDQVRLVFRDFPLDTLHPYARRAAQAAEVMQGYGKFWEYHDRLFATQQQWDTAPSVAEADVLFTQYAQELEVDSASFSARLNSEASGVPVADDSRLGNELGIQATPTFYVNGIQVPTQELKSEVKNILQAAGGSTNE